MRTPPDFSEVCTGNEGGTQLGKGGVFGRPKRRLSNQLWKTVWSEGKEVCAAVLAELEN